jgi:hypothetical protein
MYEAVIRTGQASMGKSLQQQSHQLDPRIEVAYSLRWGVPRNGVMVRLELMTLA